MRKNSTLESVSGRKPIRLWNRQAHENERERDDDFVPHLGKRTKSGAKAIRLWNRLKDENERERDVQINTYS